MIRANDDQLRELLLGQQQLMEEVCGILETEQKKDDVLSAVVRSSLGEHVNRIARLDPERVFSDAAIERICVNYRLRFLDAAHFKGSIPPRALYELRRLELRAQAPLKGFKILAPGACFRSRRPSIDPLLFIVVGSQHYYLVHKWGPGLTLFRAALAWPIRSLWHLTIAVAIAAVGLSVLLPNQVVGSLATDWWGGQRFLALLWSAMVLASVTAFGWLTFRGQFSKDVWKDNRVG